MPQTSKIATCCYCGTRAALILRGRERHELACSSCGAPLHNLKHMPVDAKRSDRRVQDRPRATGYIPEVHGKPRKSHKKKRKSKRKDWFEDIFEVIEDIFD
nr:hypothetical protein [Shimia abyssi]